MRSRTAQSWVLAAAVAAGAMSLPGAHAADPKVAAPEAETPREREARGKAFLAQHCASCHAIARTDSSKMPAAPPLRETYARFAPEDLRAMLVEGMVSRHPGMPQIDMSVQQADGIMAYLYGIAR